MDSIVFCFFKKLPSVLLGDNAVILINGSKKEPSTEGVQECQKEQLNGLMQPRVLDL